MTKYADEFGDRMKGYEGVETERRLDPNLPVYARIDGRSFSKFTTQMIRPYDYRMSGSMMNTTSYLVEKTNAKIGYTQSDEISLIWNRDNPLAELMFGGKVQKLCSVLASMTASCFQNQINDIFSKDEADILTKRVPHFDCRVFNLPSKEEAANALLWRAMDCQKNAVSMAARAHFSHKELQGKNQAEMLSMMESKCVDFIKYPRVFREGIFIRREKYMIKVPAGLPTIYKFKSDGCEVERTRLALVDMPPFKTVKNRVEVIFDGAKPEAE